jgi:hypothetical protein
MTKKQEAMEKALKQFRAPGQYVSAREVDALLFGAQFAWISRGEADRAAVESESASGDSSFDDPRVDCIHNAALADAKGAIAALDEAQ